MWVISRLFIKRMEEKNYKTKLLGAVCLPKQPFVILRQKYRSCIQKFLKILYFEVLQE